MINPYIQVTSLTNGFHRKLFQSYGNDFFPIGTGTFIHYKSEYFLVTCWHCVKFIFEENSLESFTLFAKYKDEGIVPLKLDLNNLLYFKDIDNDIVVFSLDCEFMKDNFKTIHFIDEESFSDLDSNPLQSKDLVFVTGSPYYRVEITDEIIAPHGLTLKTFFEKHEDDDITVSFVKDGLCVDDHGKHQNHEVETISGFSGGPAFRFLYNEFKTNEDEPMGFLEFIGIVQMGTSESGFIYILNIEKIKSILDTFLQESF